MSQQRASGSGNRRNTGKAGKKSSSGAKPALEPLPELPDSSAAEENTQAEASTPKSKHAKARASPRNTSASRDATAGASSKLDISFGKVVPDSEDIKAPRSAGTVTEQKKSTLADSSVAGAEGTTAAQQANMQRPRSRTASPWRGRGRGAGGIFVRNAHHRQNANRQSLGVSHGSGQSSTSPYKNQHDQGSAMNNGVPANDGSVSAGVIDENSSSAALGTRAIGYSGGDVAQRDNGAGLSAAQRRRGRTLDPEHLATKQLSPTTTGDSSAKDGRKAQAQNLRPAVSAVSPHFSISTSNAALARYDDNQKLQVLTSRPVLPVKTNSGSSGSTVQTVEIKHSPQSSIHSVEQLNTVPRGQLSKILYKETSAANSVNESQKSLEDVGNNNDDNHSVAGSISSVGRTKRRGSGAESRLGDYKGPLVRQTQQSVFGYGTRQNAPDLGYAAATGEDGEQQAEYVAQSGSQEAPSAYMSQAGSNQSARQSLRQSQGSAHSMRPGQSPSDEAWDISANAKPHGRLVGRDATRDVFSGAQQARNAGQKNRHSRGIWLYTPPSDQLVADSAAAAAGGAITGAKIHQFHTTPRTARMMNTPSLTNTNVLSPSDIANTASTIRTEPSSAENQRMSRATDVVLDTDFLHHRRSSNASTRAMPINIDEPSILPHLNHTGSEMVPSANRKVVSGSSSGKLDSIHSGGYSSDPLKLRSAGTELYDSLNGRVPASPWSFIPSSGKKRTLKFHYSGRWNAIAASPNNEPRAAVAGREGLFVFNMGPDKISQQNFVSSNRRRSMATDFKDVIWRPSDYIITGSNDGTVSIWDPTRWSESMLRKYNEIARPVNRLAHKPDNPNFVYSAFSDGSIIGWDIRAPNRAAGLRITASLSPNDIDCNPLDANMIAAISNEGRISIWDIRKLAKPLDGFSAHSASTGQCVAWHPNGRFIASSGTDSLIKVWDMKSSSSSKRYSGTAYCTIKTLVNVHRLQWRPGYDTQISSCAFVNENHLQVWDMHNPNHSLFYHDKHADKITGFTWFDENLVWSVGRDSNIIQCDMESDSIYTSGLLGNTVADFSLSSYIAVATGSSTYRHGGCFTPAQPLYPHGPSLGLVQHPSSNAGSYGNHSDRSAAASGGPASSGKSAGSAGDGINMAMFQACLPESYVDEHKLDPSIEVKALAISELAKRYRYDPDYFSECCADNANAASSVGLADVSGFWQLLSVAFGDALPLEAERKAEKSRASKSAARAEKRRLKRKQRAAAAAASADQVVEATAANVSTKEGGGDATSLRTGANSTTTSRSSSGMFASKSVIDVLPEGHSSDDEPYSKFVALESMVSMSQPISSTSTTQLRQQHTFGTPVLPSDRAAAADNITNALQKSDATRQGQGLSMSVRGLGLGAKLDRTRMSMSHTNLQQAALSSRRNGRIPSPFSRTTEHSLSGSSGAFASEPTTPLQKISHQTFHDSHTLQLEPSLMSALRVTGPGGYLKGSIGNTPKNKEAASTHESTRKLALQNAASSTMTAEQTNDDNAGLGIIEKRNGASTNNRASATTGMLVESKLQISTQKRTTKTELRMAVESCQYYADIGDVQTAVTAALLLRNFIKLPNWKVAEAWFWAYVEQLDSYKEYALATEILLASPFESVREPILEYNTITMRCSQCGAQLALLPDVGMSHCTECQRKSNSCVVCQEPVASRFIWCQGCGHGGHADHMTEWFDEMRQSSCPSGCGHMCQLLFSASAQS